MIRMAPKAEVEHTGNPQAHGGGEALLEVTDSLDSGDVTGTELGRGWEAAPWGSTDSHSQGTVLPGLLS